MVNKPKFLMFDVFPWALIEQIGTIDNTISTQVQQTLAGIEHQPTIAVKPSWYF
jgi:hypothetical protein